MNIKILDSWLKDYLDTKASAKDIAKHMSLTSISIERVEPYKNDFVYDIEVTTNRPELMSVIGLAREASAVLPQAGIAATFRPPTSRPPSNPTENAPLKIINDVKSIYRICAAVMEVSVKKSPSEITERLETTDIRSLNNLIDITNYIMRTTGHPAHVFDYDRLVNHTIRIRESKADETITTLDGKTYTLLGGDIVADDGEGTIIDLLGIMGLKNSVVTDKTQRIVLFIDNLDKHKIRKTSMGLGIRTEAAQMNEKGIDPELAMDALLYGVSLYEKYADGKLLAPLINIYPKPYVPKTVKVSIEKIQRIMGIPISLKESKTILEKLGFKVQTAETHLEAVIPSFRADDIAIPEDLVEEIARVYGYHNLPSVLPPVTTNSITTFGSNPHYWETRIKQALKYWGYTECYTYPMVSEAMYEGPLETAIRLANPLGEEFVFMRKTLIPSLLKVMQENKNVETIRIFEIANVYEKNGQELPKEMRMFAGLIKDKKINFFIVKGLLEQLASDLGIKHLTYSSVVNAQLETEVKIGKELLGSIEILDNDLINFELNFELLIKHATLHRAYKPLKKYPPIIEDITIVVDDSITTGQIITAIKSADLLIQEVTLLDKYNDARTFHILYQNPKQNLTTIEVASIHKKIVELLHKDFKARIK